MLSMCFLQDATAVSFGSFAGAAATGLGSFFGFFAAFFAGAAVAEETDKTSTAPTRKTRNRMVGALSRRLRANHPKKREASWRVARLSYGKSLHHEGDHRYKPKRNPWSTSRRYFSPSNVRKTLCGPGQTKSSAA